MRITVTVPATSANLGPGFDSFGLALDLCNEVTIDTEAEPGVTWEGEGADELPTDGTDMVTRAMRDVFERQRRQHPDAILPGIAMRGVNRIPIECGLGSSSAAAVAGIAAAGILLGDAGFSETGDGRWTTFGYAATFEGHSDNVAAAVYGGLTIVGTTLTRLDAHPDLRPAVLVPLGIRMPTVEAREALVDLVRRSDAVFNIGHAAQAAIALTQNPALLCDALQDRLHQDVRLAPLPEVLEVFAQMQGLDIPICVSGAGPSLLAFEQDGHVIPDLGDGWSVIRPGIRSSGFEVSVEH